MEKREEAEAIIRTEIPERKRPTDCGGGVIIKESEKN